MKNIPKEIMDIFSCVKIYQENDNEVFSADANKLVIRELSLLERDKHICSIVKHINSNFLASGNEYQPVWEKGWNENLENFLNNSVKKSLIPKYIKEGSPIRFNNNLYLPLSDNFELTLLKEIKHFLFKKFLIKYDEIIELGCGTGHHLLDCCHLLGAKKKYFGLDWAKSSNKLVNELASHFGLPITGLNFDMFNPDYRIVENFSSQEKGFFSIGALEQIGSRWNELYDFLLKLKPKIIIHLEPTLTLYNEDNLLDYLAIQYHKKKNWLDGYFEFLNQKHQSGEIKILNQFRTFGSIYHEAYTITIWHPL